MRRTLHLQIRTKHNSFKEQTCIVFNSRLAIIIIVIIQKNMKKLSIVILLLAISFCLGITLGTLEIKPYLYSYKQKTLPSTAQPNSFVKEETNRLLLNINSTRNCQFVEQYAQQGEGYVLMGIMRALINKPINKWKFLDIGTNDPISCSNTYLLYKKGATGVLVEPIPYLQERIHKARPKDTLLKGVITDHKKGKSKFYINKLDSLSSLIQEQAEKYKKTYNEKNSINVQEIDIELFPINDILKKYFKNGIDLLSIDAEGYDIQILKAIDTTIYRPKIIILEFQDKINGKQNFINLLKSKNYKLLFENDGDNIFVDKTLL